MGSFQKICVLKSPRPLFTSHECWSCLIIGTTHSNKPCHESMDTWVVARQGDQSIFIWFVFGGKCGGG